MYFLFTYFTELQYFIMHFNFHEDNSLIFYRKNVLSHPFLRDQPPPRTPLFLYHPFLRKFFYLSPLLRFLGSSIPPLKEGGREGDTIGLHLQMSFSLKSPAFLWLQFSL